MSCPLLQLTGRFATNAKLSSAKEIVAEPHLALAKDAIETAWDHGSSDGSDFETTYDKASGQAQEMKRGFEGAKKPSGNAILTPF